MKIGVMSWFTIFGHLCACRISSDFDGYDVGLFSCKVVSATSGKKALRLVVWRLALWVEL